MNYYLPAKNNYPSPNPLAEFFKMLNDDWYNFVSNSNQSYMQITEATFDLLCKLFCDTMKPMVLIMARDYAKQLKKQKEYNQEMIL